MIYFPLAQFSFFVPQIDTKFEISGIKLTVLKRNILKEYIH